MNKYEVFSPKFSFVTVQDSIDNAITDFRMNFSSAIPITAVVNLTELEPFFDAVVDQIEPGIRFDKKGLLSLVGNLFNKFNGYGDSK